MSIRQLIAVASLAVVLLILISVTLALAVFTRAESQLERAVSSYEQLAIATRIDGAAARRMLHVAIADRADDPVLEAMESAPVDDAIAALIERVREEFEDRESPAEQAREAQEFLAAFAIRDAYARLSRELDDRGFADGEPLAAALENFLDLDRELRAVVAAEREEVAQVLAQVSRFRQNLRLYALGAVLLALVFATAAALLALRFVMRPLEALDAGSAVLASGDITHRIAPRGPRELRQLALRLNTMAASLEAQRAALHDVNQALEATVDERTRELAEKARRLQAVDDSRRLFFAKVGHELRTPLTVLLAEAELALHSPRRDGDVLVRSLEHIRAQGENLKRRIADLLTVARSDDGTLRIRLAPVDLGGLLESALDSTAGYAHSNDVRLRAGDMPADPVAFEGDGDWLRQALLALIDNAIKFSPDGGEVLVSLAVCDDEIRFTVADEGAGVQESELSEIVKPYFQGARSSPRMGTGLGLAVAAWVAQQHRGRIEARNGSERGLVVSLVLPRD